MRKSKRGPNKHHSLGNMQEDKPSKVGESGREKASGETQEWSGFRGSWGERPKYSERWFPKRYAVLDVKGYAKIILSVAIEVKYLLLLSERMMILWFFNLETKQNYIGTVTMLCT